MIDLNHPETVATYDELPLWGARAREKSRLAQDGTQNTRADLFVALIWSVSS